MFSIEPCVVWLGLIHLSVGPLRVDVLFYTGVYSPVLHRTRANAENHDSQERCIVAQDHQGTKVIDS
jgi:hypothetical protein